MNPGRRLDKALQEQLLEHFRLEEQNTSPRRFQAVWSRSKELGRGTFGVVYLEEDIQNGAVRAVKEVRKQRGRDFKAEVHALTHLSRRAYAEFFVQFLGWYEDEMAISIVMQYFELGDLREHLKQNPLTENETRDITWQLLSGLDVMHRDGFTHRDLKPENIFVAQRNPRWLIKIGDFGVAKRVLNQSSFLQTVVGTPNYMAPELLYILEDSDVEEEEDDFNPYTNAVDIWAVGVIAFEIISFRLPFGTRSKLKSYCRGKLQFPQQVLESQGVQKHGIAFMNRLLAPLPIDRPNAGAALQDAWLCAEDEQASCAVVEMPTATPVEDKNRPAASPSQLIFTSDAGSHDTMSPRESLIISDAVQSTELPAAIPSSSSASQSLIASSPSAEVRSASPMNTTGMSTSLPSPPATAQSSTEQKLPYLQLIHFQDPQSSNEPLSFDTITRILPNEDSILQVGRYSELDDAIESTANDMPSDARIGFKSKVVSRKHCEFFYKDSSWWIKDVKSSSGTFLNRRRLSPPGLESEPFQIEDGDIVQLGLDFEGGAVSTNRRVTMKILCHHAWQPSIDQRVVQDSSSELKNGESTNTAKPEIQSLPFSTSKSSTSVEALVDGGGAHGPTSVSTAVANVSTDIRVIHKPKKPPVSVAFSPDSQYFAFGSTDNTVMMCHTMSGEAVRQFGTSRGMRGILGSISKWKESGPAIAFSPDGELLAFGVKDTIRVYYVADSKLCQVLLGKIRQLVWTIAFSPNGSLLASTCYDSTTTDAHIVQVWRTKDWKLFNTTEENSKYAYTACFLSNRLIASASYAGVNIWDPWTLGLLRSLRSQEPVNTSMAWSSKLSTIACSSMWENSIRLCGIHNGAVRVLHGHRQGVNSISFSPDGKLLVSGSRDGDVRLWDVITGHSQVLNEPATERGSISSVAFSSNGRYIICASENGLLMRWEITY